MESVPSDGRSAELARATQLCFHESADGCCSWTLNVACGPGAVPVSPPASLAKLRKHWNIFFSGNLDFSPKEGNNTSEESLALQLGPSPCSVSDELWV